MKVSVGWLSSMLGQDLDPQEVAHRLAMLGAPVDAIEATGAALADIVIGEVERVEKHPNADRLSLCHVNDGSQVIEVVCGAPNVAAGGKYPYAPVGTTLPGGLTLERRKIRGVVSNGMLCSARELELGTEHDGILELETDAPAGTSFVEAMGLGDVILDVDVTPNRPDLLCHQGVARDLSAVMRVPVKLDPIPGAPGSTLAPRTVERSGSVGGVEVVIEDVEGCPRYMAAAITGVTVGPSPEWLQQRLRGAGQRPINNIVDATNYILLELNQPLHAFDLNAVRGRTIIVRRAGEGETLTTLDGAERSLEPFMTMICDGEGPTAVAGVMGGAQSEVSDTTTDVLLECAYFDPRGIRKTRRALKMSTEASYRFERGTDAHGMAEALRRAVALIIAVGGGAEEDAPVDVYPRPLTRPTVFLRMDRVTQVLGVAIPAAEIEQILTSLGFAVAPRDERMAVQAPGWRPDVTREEDLIEEIARIRGYDSFEAQLAPIRPSTVPNDGIETAKGRARRLLTGRGLHEARSSSLVPAVGPGAVAVMNPLSQEEGFLRADLVSGLVRAAERNWATRAESIRLFEIGIVFQDRGTGETPVETLRVGGVVTGPRSPRHWSAAGKSVDFDLWDVKSLFEETCRVVGPPGRLVAAGERFEWCDDTGAMRGWAGEVEADRPIWAPPVYGFELDLVDRAGGPRQVEVLPETPPAERDVALVLPEGVTAAEVTEVILRSAGGILESASIFDEFRSDEVGGRSVAWRLVFRSRERTLRDKEVDKTVKRVLGKLREALGVSRREG